MPGMDGLGLLGGDSENKERDDACQIVVLALVGKHCNSPEITNSCSGSLPDQAHQAGATA